jgi:hypothetical protein
VGRKRRRAPRAPGTSNDTELEKLPHHYNSRSFRIIRYGASVSLQVPSEGEPRGRPMEIETRSFQMQRLV